MATLFLYTNKAQVSEDTRKAMIAAGYLPVMVADMDQVKLIETQVHLSRAQLDTIGQAALATLAVWGDSQAKGAFVKHLAKCLGLVDK
jgi:hypothetical protein